jgi:hypothetical protein
MFEVAPLVATGGTELDRDKFAVILSERWLDKYELGAILVIDKVDNRARGNRGLQILRVSTYRKFEVGIGFAYWSNESYAWNANETFALMVGRSFGKRATIRLRHWSTGGTSSRNRGLDLLTVSWKF